MLLELFYNLLQWWNENANRDLVVVEVMSSFLSQLHFQLSCALQQRIEICKLRQVEHLILGFSIGGGIDQDPGQNPFSEDKSDKVRVKQGKHSPCQFSGSSALAKLH